ncbi:MAG: alcohol dehydrogenase catalytic domain-containing protein, partial [Thermoplasmata archaeon]
GAGDIRVEETEVPEIDDDEVLIKVSYCGICGSDITAFKTGNYVPGIIIGHEFSGIVIKKGKNVNNVNEGDKVVGLSLIPCGKCEYCLSGKPNLCKNALMTGITINGAFAEYVKLPKDAVLKIDNKLNAIEATLVEPLAIVLHAINISSFKPGKSILIQGAGPIGLLTLGMMKISGASKIFLSEISDKRIEVARNLSSDVYFINPSKSNIFSFIEKETDGEGVDIIFDTTGSPTAIKSNYTLVKRGGEIVILGIPELPVESDIFTLVMDEITIKGSFEGVNEFKDAIDFISQRKVNFSSIITSIIPIEKIVDDGFKKLLEMPKEGKIVIKIGGDF